MFVNNRMDFRAGDVVGVKDTTTNEIMFGPIKLKEKRRNREWTVALGGDPHFNHAYVYEDEIFHWWPLEMMKMGNEVPAETNIEEAREYYSTHRWPTVPNTGYEEGDASSVFNLPHFGSRQFKGEFPALRNIPDAVEGMAARGVWDTKVNLPFQNGPGVKHFAAFWPRTINPERRPSRNRNEHFAALNARKKRRANMRKKLNWAPTNYRPIFSLSNHKKGKHPLSNILYGGRRTRRRRR
jgi:hypothetical protein